MGPNEEREQRLHDAKMERLAREEAEKDQLVKDGNRLADALVKSREEVANLKLQVGELQKDLEAQKEDLWNQINVFRDHNLKLYGENCEVLDALETIAKACEGAEGAALMGIGSVARRGLSHLTEKSAQPVVPAGDSGAGVRGVSTDVGPAPYDPKHSRAYCPYADCLTCYPKGTVFPHGTYRCPICGKDTPHTHDDRGKTEKRVEESPKKLEHGPDVNVCPACNHPNSTCCWKCGWDMDAELAQGFASASRSLHPDGTRKLCSMCLGK